MLTGLQGGGFELAVDGLGGTTIVHGGDVLHPELSYNSYSAWDALEPPREAFSSLPTCTYLS